MHLKADDVRDVKKICAGETNREVWLAKYRKSQLLASKRLRKGHASPEQSQGLVHEIKMVAEFDHPRVIKLVGPAWSSPSDIQALFEHMENGNLRSYLAELNTPTGWTRLKLQIAVDVADALVYIHSFAPPIVHRDIQARNVLLSSSMEAKLASYGAARKALEPNATGDNRSGSTADLAPNQWQAPEVLTGDTNIDQAADIFSFGVLLSELDTNGNPYGKARGPDDQQLTDNALQQTIAAGATKPHFSASCPSDLRALAERCVALDPHERPGAPEIAYGLRNVLKSLA